MKTKFLRGDKQIALALIFVVFTLSFVSAIPGIPHQFWGSVKDLNNNPAPDGILVIAKIDGSDVAAGITENGAYGLGHFKFYIPDPDSVRAGKTIDFFINDVKVADYIFENGGTTELNLVVSGVDWGTNPNNNGGSGDSSGGGGSSGGSGGSSYAGSSSNNANAFDSNQNSLNNLTDNSTSCIENWECSNWLDCTGHLQRRVCVDKNSCGTEKNKPIIQRECNKELTNTESNGITGYFLNVAKQIKNPLIDAILIFLIVLILILFFYIKKKNKKIAITGSENKKEIKKKNNKTTKKKSTKKK